MAYSKGLVKTAFRVILYGKFANLKRPTLVRQWRSHLPTIGRTIFHDYQAENPLKPLPADKLDEEFSRVKTTLDAVLQNLALIQRDDTALANKSVGYDQLKDEIQLGFNPPTDWMANHNYVARDTVFRGRVHLSVPGVAHFVQRLRGRPERGVLGARR